MLEEQCDGFATEPVDVAVPAPFVYDVTMSGREGVGDYWSLLDLDDDGVLDLIEHHHGNNADGDAMGEAWYVWWGEGLGFGARTDYALPLDHRELDGLYGANFVQAVFDVTGDGVPDLVMPEDPVTREVWDAEGDRHWRVFAGEGRSGFATEPIAWSVPAPIDHQVHSSRTGGMAWTTFDLDGDGVVELVQTAAPGVPGTLGFEEGTPHWRVYANLGDGFDDDYEVWPLPPLPDDRDGMFTDHTQALPQRSVRTQDLTGDGLPDLIATRATVWPYAIWGGEEDPHWLVYVNEGDGFADEAIAWSVPSAEDVYPSSGEDWIVEVSRELDTLVIGAGMPNLVRPAAGGWDVYRNRGTGFDDEPTPWAVPDAVFGALWADGGAVAEGWTTVDLDGDGCLDLVLTAGLDLGVPDAGTTTWTWRVWPGA